MNGNSPIEEIKNRLDIVEVIGSYVKLQKAGANFRALCPFHSEKTPSFFVSPSRQIWHCFGGCGTGGDIFKFIMRIEGVEFGDALRILAQKAGVELKRERPELKTERQRLYEICELAAKFFEKQLTSSKVGKEAKEYLLSRGITEDSIKKWRLGYSPDTWQGLSDFLVGRGYQREEIEKAGLCVKNEQGSFYDRFRGRIIFPVFDLNSQIIGFGGRVFGEKSKDETAKYVNTPNTLLYDKSKVLYGLNEAKIAIRNKNECILVEGYTDVILVSQSGFENVVASSGTALTPYQLKILKRYSENLLIAFDMDMAGDSATKRGINLAQTMGFNIKVLLLPKDSDPADVASKNPALLAKLIKESRSILDFYFETTFSTYNSDTLEGKKEISKILLPVIKMIPSSIERSFWIQKLAKRLEVKEEDVVEELKKVKQDENFLLEQEQPLEGLKTMPRSRKELLEERLLTLILKFPQYINSFGAEERTILDDLKKKAENSQDYFNYLSLKAETEEFEQENILPEIKFCFKEIRFLNLKNELEQISRDIKRAEEEKNIQKVEELTKNFHRLSKQIQLA
jgi:DNA primase